MTVSIYCGGLSGKCLPYSWALGCWFPVDATVWRDLGGMALWEEKTSPVVGFETKSLMRLQILSLSLQLPVPASSPVVWYGNTVPAVKDFKPLES